MRQERRMSSGEPSGISDTSSGDSALSPEDIDRILKKYAPADASEMDLDDPAVTRMRAAMAAQDRAAQERAERLLTADLGLGTGETGERLGGAGCWLRLRPVGFFWWRAGNPGHCAVWYYATPWGALRGARRLHRRMKPGT